MLTIGENFGKAYVSSAGGQLGIWRLGEREVKRNKMC